MKRYYAIIAACLLASLFLYVFYRSGDTVVNRMIIAVFSGERFMEARSTVTGALPLPGFFVYSLPEALWVFCTTLLSKNLFFTVRRHAVKCLYFPLGFAYLWELLQLSGVTRGYFDWLDILSCTAASLLAQRFFRPPYAPVHVFGHFSWQALYFFAAFAIVYLSHVAG